jgi:putative transposase
VPSGLKRYYGSGDLHFITASCYRRHPLLASASRRDLFIKVLEQVRRRYQFVLVGYVVMPAHFHLLISEPEKGNPSTVIQALKLGIVRQLFPTSRKGGEKWGTPSTAGFSSDLPPKHFWQRRFYDFNVWTAHKRVEKLKYIHRNPVRRGFCGNSRSVAMEQFPRVRVWRTRAGRRQRLVGAENESSRGLSPLTSLNMTELGQGSKGGGGLMQR